ncbi:hypothetical protein M422DRAFT_243474 [Sphaerobolus stellatus SS14]|nr:hypothetical protein M422DRAFT_243474 [Sphaerobolus stellatus SS14]
MSNIPNGRDTITAAPNAPRIYPILLPEVDMPSVGARAQQGPQNVLPTPRDGFIPLNAPAPQQQPLPGRAIPPNAPRMSTIPLPDV